MDALRALLAEHGRYRRAISTFPSLTPVCLSSLATGALIDREAGFVWGCAPRVDGDPLFCSLLEPKGESELPRGEWRISVENQVSAEPGYLRNTPILTTRLTDSDGAVAGTILIVEDNEMNRDMLSRRLERKGYTVLIAIDGAALTVVVLGEALVVAAASPTAPAEP